jgi:hypothetical protein
MIGGTASVIGGGKFKNGAITAAFSRMFNDELYSEALKAGAKAAAIKNKISRLHKMSPKQWADQNFMNLAFDEGFTGGDSLMDVFENWDSYVDAYRDGIQKYIDAQVYDLSGQLPTAVAGNAFNSFGGGIDVGAKAGLSVLKDPTPRGILTGIANVGNAFGAVKAQQPSFGFACELRTCDVIMN